MATSKSKIRGITIEFDGNTTKLGKALEGIEKNTKSLQSELNGVNTLLKFDPSNTDLLRQKQELLTKSIEVTGEKQRILNETLKKIKNNEITVTNEEFRDLQREIVATEKKLAGFKDQMKDFGSIAEQKITVVANKVKDLGSKIENAGSKLNKISAVAAAGVTASVITASSLEDAVAKYIATTGKAVDETEKYQEILQSIHDNNYGEDFGDIADKMRIVSTTMKDLPDDQLQSVVEKTYALQDAYGMDFEETLRGINGLITNMGVSAEEAFDLMTVGAQNGLDKTHELGDNLAEYTQIWGQAGFTAQEMFSILQNGLDAGAYNLDKVNDFVKEFTISLSDGRIKENISSFSKDTQKLFKAWEKGKATSADVFKSVINDLKNTKDEQEALSTASTVWSALGEDNALKIITSLNDVNDTYKDTTGAINKTTETMYDTTSNEAQSAFKKIKSSAAELSNNLLPIISKILDAVNNWIDKFNNLDDGTKNVIMTIALLTSGMSLAVTGIGKMVTGVGNTITILGKLTTVITNHPILTLATVIGGVVAAIGSWINASEEKEEQSKISIETIKEETNEIKAQADAYRDTMAAREESVQAGLNELDYYANLFSELQTLVEENGKVKEGYESRASFITSTLSESMGLEIEMVGNTIKNYQELGNTFTDVMEKQKAMLVLDAQKESYTEAISNIKLEKEEMLDAAAKAIEAQETLNNLYTELENTNSADLSSIITLQQLIESQEEYYNELYSQYESHAETYNTYLNNIGMYEENYKLAHEGRYNEMMTTEEEYLTNQAINGEASISTIQTLIDRTTEKLEQLKLLKENSNSEQFDADIANYEKTLETLNEALDNQKNAVDYGMNEINQEWLTSLGEQLSTITTKKIEFQNAGDGTVQAYIDGTKIKEPVAQENFKAFATNLINELDLDEDAEEKAKNLLDGFNLGLNNQSKQNSVFSSAGHFAAKLLNKFNKIFDINSPSKKTQKIGEYIDEGLKIGIDGKSNDILKTVDSVGQDVLNRMQKIMSTEISTPDLNKNVLVHTTTDFSASKSISKQNDSINSLISTVDVRMTEILQNMKSLKVYLDKRTLVGEIAPDMDNELGVISSKRKRGRS